MPRLRPSRSPFQTRPLSIQTRPLSKGGTAPFAGGTVPPGGPSPAVDAAARGPPLGAARPSRRRGYNEASMAKPLAAITGASAGLGAVFARKLAARGYDLLLIARRGDRLRQLAGEIGGAEPLVADLTLDADIERVAQRLSAEPRLALLVNNAGFGVHGLFARTPLEDQARMHRLHIDCVLRLTHAAVGGMAERNAGGVINVASVAGFLRSRGSVSYGATKAWMIAFSEGLYLEMRKSAPGVTVQALCPGFTYTEFHDAAHLDRAAVPKYLWLDAERVVDDSLAGLDRRKLFVVPGKRYQLIVAIVTKLPAAWRVALEAWSPQRRDVPSSK